LSPGAALVYSITACFSTTLAGAYVAFSATTTDQQVAGLIMWVPCCMIYLSVTLAIVLRAMYGASSMASQQAN
jgi:cytochrome c oxidase assembly factor CtaG